MPLAAVAVPLGETIDAACLSGSICLYLVSADSCGLAADCETITRQELKVEDETMSGCRVCGPISPVRCGPTA